MLEVERKARVTAVPELETKILERGSLEKEITKEDRYYLIGWSPGRPIDFETDPIFRVRASGGRATLGWKARTFVGTTEVNEEREIDLGDPDGLIEWLEGYLGLEPFGIKRKHTRLFRLSGRLSRARVELNNVEGLGDFIEVEVMCEPPDRDEAVGLIDEVFGLLGIADEAVETRYYIDLLMGR